MKVALDLYTQRVAGAREIFENHVDHMFVKNLDVTKRVDIKLQTLELDTPFVGNILEPNNREVREIREGADRSELGDLKLDPNLAPGEFVKEGIEGEEIHLGAGRRPDIESLLVRNSWFSWRHYLSSLAHDLNRG